MNIVFFDFDGTITRKDSFIEFIKFAKGPFYFYLTAPIILLFYGLFFIKIISAEEAKRRILKFHFKGYSKFALEEIGEKFIEKILSNGMIKKEMLDLINFYKTSNSQIAVVSASFDIWIKPFCSKNNIGCICTKLAYSKGDFFDGELDSLNCKGVEKAKRIINTYNLNDYTEIIAYGDSSGDIEMMGLATEKHWV